MEQAIDEVAAALIREYLVTKKLTKSYHIFNEDKPKTSEAYNKRGAIGKTLHIDQLINKNKEQKRPLSTILEIIVKHLIESCPSFNSDDTDYTEGSKITDRSLPVDQALKGILIKNSPKRRSPTSKKNHLHFSDEYLHTPFTQNSEMKTASSASFKTCNNLNQGESTMDINNFDDKDYEDMITDNYRLKKSKRLSHASVQLEEMTLDDIEDDDYDDISVRFSASTPFDKHLPVVPISRAKAKELRALVFGTTVKNFNREWKSQNFEFSTHPQTLYGLIQKKAGPCGIIACVQSYIIRELLYPKVGEPVGLKPSPAEIDCALKMSLCRILWKIGQEKKAILAIFNARQVSYGTSDKNPESLLLLECHTLAQLECCVEKYLDTFKRDDSGGCISLLYSALLSRGIENVRFDMDEPNGHLIGVHGYCTLEMVNLFLTGRAHSNVFDGIIKLDSGGDELSVLHGITFQSEVGFLSLFEHYNSCNVGLYMKNPVYPIWVVCSESHFTVLFSDNILLVGPKKQQPTFFELIYYDSLGNNDGEIRLMLDLELGYSQETDDDMIPPLEHCIRTKWPGATIQWRGCEPLL